MTVKIIHPAYDSQSHTYRCACGEAFAAPHELMRHCVIEHEAGVAEQVLTDKELESYLVMTGDTAKETE